MLQLASNLLVSKNEKTATSDIVICLRLNSGKVLRMFKEILCFIRKLLALLWFVVHF